MAWRCGWLWCQCWSRFGSPDNLEERSCLQFHYFVAERYDLLHEIWVIVEGILDCGLVRGAPSSLLEKSDSGVEVVDSVVLVVNMGWYRSEGRAIVFLVTRVETSVGEGFFSGGFFSSRFRLSHSGLIVVAVPVRGEDW